MVTFFEILDTHLSLDGKCGALYRIYIAFTIMTSHQDTQITLLSSDLQDGSPPARGGALKGAYLQDKALAIKASVLSVGRL